MESRDGQVPAPRRAALPIRRRTADTRPASPVQLPFGVPDEDRPRVADLSALLGEIDALRLTLQTDLSLAAAALEADAAGLAVELVDGDLAEVRAFGARSAARFADLQADELVEVDEADELVADEVPVVAALPRRRILSAAPLMAAAAALIGFVAFVPDRGGVQSPETTMTSAAMAGWELNRLAREGAPDEALRLAAMELNDELAELIAQAATDPAAAQQALMLLDSTTEVLAGQDERGVLRDVLAEARALRERLRDTLPAEKRTTRTTRTVIRSVAPALPRVEEQSERPRTSSAPASPKPSSSPKPSPSAAPTSPPPAPSPEPSSASPEPSSENEGPLSGTDGLPGF